MMVVHTVVGMVGWWLGHSDWLGPGVSCVVVGSKGGRVGGVEGRGEVLG